MGRGAIPAPFLIFSRRLRAPRVAHRRPTGQTEPALPYSAVDGGEKPTGTYVGSPVTLSTIDR